VQVQRTQFFSQRCKWLRRNIFKLEKWSIFSLFFEYLNYFKKIQHQSIYFLRIFHHLFLCITIREKNLGLNFHTHFILQIIFILFHFKNIPKATILNEIGYFETKMVSVSCNDLVKNKILSNMNQTMKTLKKAILMKGYKIFIKKELFGAIVVATQGAI